MRKTFFLILLIGLALGSFSLGSQVAAQSPSPTPVRRTPLSNRQEDRCTRIQDRITNRQDHYSQARDRRHKIYQGVMQRLTNLVQKFESRGCDASQVKTDLTSFQGLVDDMVAAFNLFIDKLPGVGTLVCQEGPGRDSGKTLSAEAKAQLEIAKQKHQAVRNFYKNTLKSDVQVANQACRGGAR